MPDEVAELVARAERCRAQLDLDGAAKALGDAWASMDEHNSLRAAQIQKRIGSVELLRGQYGWAGEGYKHARRILTRLDQSDPHVRTEVVRCSADQGQLDLQQGRRTRALSRLTEALELDPAGADADSVRLLVAQLHLTSVDHYEKAQVLIDDVASRLQNDKQALSGLAVRVHEARGLLAAARDEHREALHEFDVLDQHLGNQGDPLIRARNQQNRASVLLAMGEPGQAQDLLSELLRFYKAHGLRGLELVATTDKGMVELALGAREDAARLFAAVDERYQATGEFDPRERARNLDGWGNAAQLDAKLEDAAARHGEALSLLDDADAQEKRDGWAGAPWGQVDRARVMSHLATDHLLTYRLRYVVRAKQLLAEAAGLLEGLTGTEVAAARCHANLGVALALLGEFDDAEAYFERASGVFKRKKRLLEQVAANHNRGCTVAQSSGRGRERLCEALDLLVPAALVRDSVRYALSSAEQRSRWWEQQAAASLTEALRVARSAGHPQLVTDLILTFRLPGPVELGSVEDRPSTWFTALPSEPAALEPDPSLQLAHGPQLRVPSGRVSLARYLDLARNHYGRDVRTDGVAAIAGISPAPQMIQLSCLDRGGGDVGSC